MKTSKLLPKELRSVQKFISKLCTPAFLYLILSVMSTFMYIYVMLEASNDENMNEPVHHYTLFGLICKIVWHLLFLLFLDYLCRKGHKTISWIVLFLPFLLMIFIALMLMFIFAFYTNNNTLIGKVKQELVDNNKSNQAKKKRDSYSSDGRPMITPSGISSYLGEFCNSKLSGCKLLD